MKKILAGAALTAVILAGLAGPAHAGGGPNGIGPNGWGNGVSHNGAEAKSAEAGKAALITVVPTVTAVRLPNGATVSVDAR